MASKNPFVKMQSIIDAQDYPFVVIDKNYNVVGANKMYCETYGVDSRDVVGRKCHQVSHHSDRPCHQNGEDCPHQHVFEHNEAHQVLHVHYDQNDQPEHVRIKGSPLVGANGEFFLGEAVFRLARSDELGCDSQRMVGKSTAFQKCVEEVTRIADSEATVLICGESGVGKDLAAKYIHQQSDRRGYAFVTLDCATISEELFERELFGYERGAFTGCVGRRHGLFESADRGTLFLNEVDEIPLSVQGRLMSAIETGHYRRVGGRELLHADVRIIAATNVDLAQMVEAGTFRADLFYRISGVTTVIPPLRDRKEDIPALVEALIGRLCESRKSQCHLTDEAMDMLREYDYPGNIRQLKNILQKAVVLSTGGVIGPEQIDFQGGPRLVTTKPAPVSADAPTGDDASIQELEAEHIRRLLDKHGGHRRKVAEMLGVSERTLYRKLQRYGLQDIGKASGS